MPEQSSPDRDGTPSYSYDNKGRMIPDLICSGETLYPYGFLGQCIGQPEIPAEHSELVTHGTRKFPKIGTSVFFCPDGINDGFDLGAASTGNPDNLGGSEPWVRTPSPRSAYNNYAHWYNTYNAAGDCAPPQPDDVACCVHA